MFNTYEREIIQQLIQDEIQRIESGAKVFADPMHARQIKEDLANLLTKVSE